MYKYPDEAHHETLAALVNYLAPILVRLRPGTLTFRSPAGAMVQIDIEGDVLRYGSTGEGGRHHTLRWERVGDRSKDGNIVPSPDATAKAIAFVKKTLVEVDKRIAARVKRDAERDEEEKKNKAAMERALGVPADTHFRLFLAGVMVPARYDIEWHTCDEWLTLKLELQGETAEKILGALRDAGLLTLEPCDEDGEPLKGIAIEQPDDRRLAAGGDTP